MLILLVNTLLAYSSISYCDEQPGIWRNFINKADIISYKACQIDIWKATDSKGGKYSGFAEKELIDDRDLYFGFLRLIRDGNIYAIELATQIYPFTEASRTEDLCQAIGVRVAKDTEFFLYLVIKYNIANDILEDMISMYPLNEVVDNLPASIKITNERLKAFKAIKRGSLIIPRDKCIKILEKHRRFYNRAKLQGAK
jgi:hypothetical protein